MSPRSFKRNLGQRPPYYRTPSPPQFDSEPISPIHNEGSPAAHKVPRQDGGAYLDDGTKADSYAQHLIGDLEMQRGNLPNTMEAFASIALAVIPANQGQIERPLKRARSEKLRSPEWTRPRTNAETRPLTSYEQISDSRTLEAELLLNFSHEARYSTTQKQIRHINLNLPGEHHHAVADQARSYQSASGYKDEQVLGVSSASPVKLLPSKIMETGHDNCENRSKVTVIVCQDPPTEDCKPTRKENHIEICEKDQTNRRLSEEEAPNSGSEYQTSETVYPQKIDLVNQPRTDCHQGVALSNGLGEKTARERNLATLTEENRVIIQGSAENQKLPPTSGIGRDLGDIREIGNISEVVSDTNLLADVEAILQPHEQRPKSPLAGAFDGKELASRPASLPAVCSACHFIRNSSNVDTDHNSTSWISCDGCKSWFHFACAGFKNEREVRSVDKFRCRICKPIYGPTTYVRKSSRAHSAIDYAGLNEGVLKTSDERPEHHYIKPIKDGTITFLPEKFARMRPEWITAEFFEKGNGMKEPIVIPAHFNPQPKAVITGEVLNGQEDPEFLEEWLTQDVEYQSVPDHGQDGLDMVMPLNLSVRKVADLYGPEEKVEVIDVKSQNGEGKKWNMRRWADYYESSSNKAVRNVISLEVSQSKLGRLIRRPQIVRDLDLQDSVWPHELQAKGEFPRVQLYCLMSVADCFTDFHIDFGGSSVFYHILKGKKTFLFIPPKEKHLKKYEEWCMSPAQNWTFLADQTKECYRVDLAEGDTMLIPAGWIHAVWTPEDSLVIGGNFLTRMHYGMQFRIAQIEKNTGVARKFRYPHFQKLHWYTALQYLEDDPLPDTVRVTLQEGGVFHRESPAHYAYNDWGENSISGMENYHARYYSQAELDGVPDLIRYLLRTALIDLGSITEGITMETRNAVKKAIPRGHGEPLDIVKDLALWCAWKRGNEPIPHWAYPHAVPEGGASDSTGKLSAAALKKLDQDAALQAPRRQSARRQTQLHLSSKASALNVVADSHEAEADNQTAADTSNPAPLTTSMNTPSKRTFNDMVSQGPSDASPPDSSKRQRRASKSGTGSHRKPACESCRKRRRACRHRDLTEDSLDNVRNPEYDITGHKPASGDAWTGPNDVGKLANNSIDGEHWGILNQHKTLERPNGGGVLNQGSELKVVGQDIGSIQHKPPGFSQGSLQATGCHDVKPSDLGLGYKINGSHSRDFDLISGNPIHGRGRAKACIDCRKSKRRCIHDELGNEDPVKARAAAIPRPAASLKRRKIDTESPNVGSTKEVESCQRSESFDPQRPPSLKIASPTFHPNSPVVINRSPQILLHRDHELLNSNLVKSEPIPQPSSRPEPTDVRNQKRAETPDEKLRFSQANHSNMINHDMHDSKAEPMVGEIKNGECETASTPGLRPIQPSNHQSSDPEESENIEQPAALSLVSPPASSHDDMGKSPPPSQAELTPSTSSSRHSSRHLKQVRRYTPESGSARRTSSSSAGEANTGKSAFGDTGQPTVPTSPAFSASRRHSKADGGPDVIADEESLKLIKELQAEEHGLRRRRRS